MMKRDGGDGSRKMVKVKSIRFGINEMAVKERQRCPSPWRAAMGSWEGGVDIEGSEYAWTGCALFFFFLLKKREREMGQKGT